MEYEIRFLYALLLTVAVECTAIVIMMRFIPFLRDREVPLTRCIIAGTAPSFATLPYLWFILPAFILSYPQRLITGECAVALVETVLIRYFLPLSWRKSAVLSFVANSTSILAGLLVF